MSNSTKSAGWRRALLGSALGLGASTLENETLLSDADPQLKHINQFLGTLTGGAAPAKGIGKYLGRAWLPKQMAMFGLNAYDKNVKQQVPIAETQLDTATKALETAKIQADAAKHISPSDIARLGMAGAGIGAAGGLGYYLYNTMGPGKKKPAPKVTVTLDGKHKGETQVEGDMDTLELSKQLHQALRRDTKRKLREEARSGIRHTPHHDHPERTEAPQEDFHGIVREKPEASTMSNIMNLLRN